MTTLNYGAEYGKAQYLFPYLPAELLQLYVEKWVETADPVLAAAYMRASPRHAQFFPAYWTQPGVPRFSNEQEYLTVKAAYRDAFLDYGINPSLFEGRFVQLIEGNVSESELRSRLTAMNERIVDAEPELQRVYSEYYGIEMNRGALLAAAIDPQLEQEILARRITTAEIGGAAALAGFRLQQATAKGLYEAGVSEGQARQMFRQAGVALPALGRAAERQAEGAYGLETFLGSLGLAGTVGEQREAEEKTRRVLAGEASQYSEQEFAAQTKPYALTGLSRR